MGELIVRAEHITKSYRKISGFHVKESKVLDDASIHIHRGDIYGFVGVNGAGKTTLMRVITGLCRPQSGEIELFGGQNCQRSRMGGIIEAPTFYPYMTARENLRLCQIMREKERSDQEIDDLFSMTGLDEYDTEKLKAGKFSLGMKKRLGLAMALLGEPEFLFLDEPLNGLDPIGIENFHELIRKLNREKHMTILISSHLLRNLEQVATCYGFIHQGKMLKEISAADLNEKGKIETYFADLIGKNKRGDL